jgi:hypothetical protein
MRISKAQSALGTLLLAVLLPSTAGAQLYTWKDAEGNLVIKNAPPPWYKEASVPRASRVQVLRNGKVVDDTAWPADKRQDGRNKDAREEAVRANSEATKKRTKDEE